MRYAAVCPGAVAAVSPLLLVLSSAALAQERSLADGLVPPGRSFAIEDEASALSGNPGGLAFVDGFSLDTVHEGFANDSFGNGLYLASRLGPLAAGASLEWPRFRIVPQAPSAGGRRTTFGLGLRLGALGVGASHHSRSYDFLPSLSSWDVGALARPFRWLSLGVALLEVDRPDRPDAQFRSSLPLRTVASVAIRPLGERLTLASDATFRSCERPRDDSDVAALACGGSHPDWTFTGEARVAPGLSLIAQVIRPALGSSSVFAGLQLDLARLGVRAGPTFYGGGESPLSIKVRLSSLSYPGARLPSPRAVELDLRQSLRRPKPGALGLLFGEKSRDPLALTLETLRRIARDGSVQAVVLRSGELPLGLGRTDELRKGIEGLRASGKKVIFYLESGGDLEYAVASTADRVFAAPQAVLAVNGFSATALFAAEGLDKLGVKAEFIRSGAYKTAPDLFTRSGMSGEQREVVNAILDDEFRRYVRQVSERRRLGEAKFKRLLDRGLLKPQEARDEGLIDGLAYADELEGEMGKLLGERRVRLTPITTQAPRVRSLRWDAPPRIAVVRVEGTIVRGESQEDPFGVVELAGSQTIARRIRTLADDPNVAALVVRIDSPGGDGNASDLIWRELSRARKEKGKPVVASMGDVAASGGYYVAVAADQIFAEPSTITGSIGVFVGHFEARELYGKLGLNWITLKRGESADLFSTARGLTDAERTMLQSWVDSFYAQFVDRVAEGRRLSREEVDRLGRGRVYTGAQALELRLVDRLGGLDDALEAARRLAGIEEVAVDDEGKLQAQLSPAVSLLPALAAGPAGAAFNSALPDDFARTLRALALLGAPGTLRACLPFEIEVR